MVDVLHCGVTALSGREFDHTIDLSCSVWTQCEELRVGLGWLWSVCDG